VVWPVIRELMSIRERLDSCLGEGVFPGSGQRAGEPSSGPFCPAADLYEDDRQVVVVTEIPGVEVDAVELTLIGDRLRIAGRMSPSNDTAAGGRFLRMERAEGGFFRDYHLPRGPFSDNPEATLERGVLTVRLARTEETEARRVVVVEDEA